MHKYKYLTNDILGNLFLIIVYGYLMFLAASYLSTGSELFLEILGPGIVGGLYLPMLCALPDALLILGQCLTFHFDLLIFLNCSSLYNFYGGFVFFFVKHKATLCSLTWNVERGLSAAPFYLRVLVGSYFSVARALVGLLKLGTMSMFGTLLVIWGLVKEGLLGKHVNTDPTKAC
ncbi:hypothetical protein IFM89_024177 [Coptis chinensis]|uniref:Uncharacterized protein n=1 Tax=Coptis chinensis TaxID=261450 RepID=A0A835LJ44_9MAGN|nr:hypothetical protein IFM89_024177 [Coptis chinensis]